MKARMVHEEEEERARREERNADGEGEKPENFAQGQFWMLKSPHPFTSSLLGICINPWIEDGGPYFCFLEGSINSYLKSTRGLHSFKLQVMYVVPN